MLLRLKIPLILHSIEFEILMCTMLKIAFPGLQISKVSGRHALLETRPPRPDPSRGPRLRRSYLTTPLNKYCCQYEHPSKNLSYGPGSGCQNVTNNSSFQNYSYPDDQTIRTKVILMFKMIDQKLFLFLIMLTPISVDLLLPISICTWITNRIQ